MLDRASVESDDARMFTVSPTRLALSRFADETPDEAPIVMVNLLRFRDVADYGPSGARGVSGRKAYAEYSRGVLPLLLEVGGLPLWRGEARASLIAPEGERWDEVLLVHYPSRRAFLRMVSSRAYAEVMPHRSAALEDSRLVETRVARLPRSLLRLARAAIRVKALVRPAIDRA